MKISQMQVKYHDLLTSTRKYQSLNCLSASNKTITNLCFFSCFISVCWPSNIQKKFEVFQMKYFMLTCLTATAGVW